MTTLFDATLAVARELGVARQGTATGGSTTTIIDTGRNEVDDAFNGGTAWIVSADSAAPEDEYATISDWVNSTGTATISAVTAAVASGDVYVLTTARYPLDVLISAINSELIKYWVPRWDKTSLDVVSGQSEYDLPAGHQPASSTHAVYFLKPFSLFLTMYPVVLRVCFIEVVINYRVWTRFQTLVLIPPTHDILLVGE